jgi:hypothetical protein
MIRRSNNARTALNPWRGRLPRSGFAGVTVALVCTALGCTALACTTLGCARPTLELRTDPVTAEVYVDGRRVARGGRGGAAKMPLRYYGTTAILGRGAAGSDAPELLDRRVSVTFAEPYSAWLFPVDFLLEVATFPFQSGRYEHRIEIALEARPELVGGIRPRNLGAIEQTARGAVLER